MKGALGHCSRFNRKVENSYQNFMKWEKNTRSSEGVEIWGGMGGIEAAP